MAHKTLTFLHFQTRHKNTRMTKIYLSKQLAENKLNLLRRTNHCVAANIAPPPPQEKGGWRWLRWWPKHIFSIRCVQVQSRQCNIQDEFKKQIKLFVWVKESWTNTLLNRPLLLQQHPFHDDQRQTVLKPTERNRYYHSSTCNTSLTCTFFSTAGRLDKAANEAHLRVDRISRTRNVALLIRQDPRPQRHTRRFL